MSAGRPNSFNSKVKLPRDSAACKHERHFHGFMRSIVHKLDYKGAESEKNYGVRFCFAKWDYFHRMCQNTHHDRPSRDTVFACLRRAEELGIIVPDLCDISGEVRPGCWVADHASITKILDRDCLWCDDAADKARRVIEAKKQAIETKKRAEKTGINPTAGPNKSDCDLELIRLTPGINPTINPTDLGISATNKSDSEIDAVDTKDLTCGDPSGISASNKSDSRLGEVRSEGSTNEVKAVEVQAQDPGKSNGNPNSNGAGRTSFSDRDLTLPTPKAKATGSEKQTPTIGDIPCEDLEEMLDAISDGLFETGALQNYSEDYALESAIRQAIGKHKASPLSDRKNLAPVVSEVMNVLKHAGLRWPPGLLPVLIALRAGGPLQQTLSCVAPVAPVASAIVRGDVFDGSVLNWPEWRADLEPHRELLQEAANTYGVPYNFFQGADFLKKVSRDLQGQGKPVPEGLQRAEVKMRERIPS